MKKSYYFSALTALVFALAGCSEADLDPGTDDSSYSEDEVSASDEKVLVKVNLPGYDTRTSYGYNSDSTVMKTSWEENDVIYALNGGNKLTFTQYGHVYNDGKSSSFWWSSGTRRNNRYILYCYTGEEDGYPGTNSTMGSYVISSQTGAREDMKYYDIMTCYSKVGSDGTFPEINFTRQVAWLRLSDLDFGSADDAQVKSIYLNGADFHNFIYINPNNGSQAVKSKATITVTPDSLYISDGKLTDEVFIAFFPDPDAKAGDAGTITVVTSDGTYYQKTWNASEAYTAGNMYTLSGDIAESASFNIQFKDPLVKLTLLESVYSQGTDVNGDGEISNIEASLVSDLNWRFMETKITSFDEFVYFTGITEIYGGSEQSGGFYGCTNLQSISLPASLKKIGHDSFNGCTSLESVTIPESVTEIDAGAFRNCTSLETIEIPDSVSYMGQGLTFAGCTSLKKLNWPMKSDAINTQTFDGCSSLEEIDIPDSLKSIGLYAFRGCSSLKSLELPEGFTTIGKQAFLGCNSLALMNIPSTVNSIAVGALNNLYNLNLTMNSAYYKIDNSNNIIYTSDGESVTCLGKETELTIPEGVTTLAQQSFSGLSKLLNVVIPADVTLESNVFENDSSLVTAVYESGCVTTGNYTFSNCVKLSSVTLPEGLTTLGIGVFSGCSSLTELTLPSTIETVGTGVFKGCSSLQTVVLPSGMTTVPNDLFNGCSALTNVELEEGITKIGNNVFKDCISLTSITLPSTLTQIGSNAFNGCTGITSFDIPTSVTKLGTGVFANCTGITTLTIPSSITSIPTNMVAGCTNLEELNLPSTITTLPSGAFKGTGLKSFVLPSGMTSIPNGLFQDCTKLESVTIPSKVTTINANAFAGCTSLTVLDVPANVTKIYSGAFENSGLVTLTLEGVTEIPTFGMQNIPNLATLNIPAVQTIGTMAFEGCTSLTELTLPATLNSIAAWAFSSTNISTITMEKETPPSVKTTSFYTGEVGYYTEYVDAIYVPDASVSAYKESWGDPWASLVYAVSTK
jgi:hypothetical protein